MLFDARRVPPCTGIIFILRDQRKNGIKCCRLWTGSLRVQESPLDLHTATTMPAEPLVFFQLREIELQTPNPQRYAEMYQWRMKVEVLSQLTEPVTISFLWAGSSNDESFDQVLDEVEVGPLVVGPNEFVISHEAPDWRRIPQQELLGVTLLVMHFSYRGNAFLRVGYYTNVALLNAKGEMVTEAVAVTEENAPNLARNVLFEKPYVRTFPIAWDVEEVTEPEDSHID
jgi:histone chaperone ASF1